MRTKLGAVLILLGCVLMLGALWIGLCNWQEQEEAAEASGQAITQLVEAIHTHYRQSADEDDQKVPETQEPTLPEERQMLTVEIDGNEYIGFVGIPSLELELPVMADWSYAKLRVAPCRFAGTTYGNNLVVMAHNYLSHFGRLKELRVGDAVTFTDMQAQTICYQVAALDILSPDAVEDMTAGEYDLTLFTCTYGGSSRIAVGCDRNFEQETR